MTAGGPDDRSEVNARLTAIEQKLQELPTRDEFETRLAQLPTRNELYRDFVPREELYRNFLTRDEFAARTDQQSEDLRRYFNVVAESLRDDIRLLAEGQTAIIARLDATLADRDADRATLAEHDLRLTRLERHAGFEPPRPPRPRRR
jgi:hypothetical protein